MHVNVSARQRSCSNLLQVMQVIQVPVSDWIAHDHLECIEGVWCLAPLARARARSIMRGCYFI